MIFQGEYLNNLKIWKRKEYNINGVLIFEGEYLNGLKMKNLKNMMKMGI